MIEPSIEQANSHALTFRPYSRLIPQSRLCPCCNRPLDLQPLPLLCGLESLRRLGVCFPLYFRFIKDCGRVLFLMGMWSLMSLSLNLLGTGCIQKQAGTICQISIANVLEQKKIDADILRMQSWLNSILGLCLIFFVQKLRMWEWQSAQDLAYDQVEVSQFAVMLSDLPENNTPEAIRERVGALASEIEKIYLLRDISQLRNARENMLKAEDNLCKVRGNAIQEECLLDELQQRLSQFNSSQQTLNLLIKRFKAKEFQPDFKYLGKAILLFKQTDSAKAARLLPGVLPCEQPSDIIWFNLGAKPYDLTAIPVAFTLMAGLIVTLFKSLVRAHIQPSLSPFLSFFLNLLVAGAIALINSLLGICIRVVTAQEQHQSYSSYFRTVGSRLSAVFFMNMVGTTFLVNSYFAIRQQKTTNMVQLANDYFFLFITNSYIASLFNYFDLVYGFRLLKRMLILRSIRSHSQRELNAAFQGHPVDMALRYANILKTMHLVAFVGPILPIGPLIALLGLLITYWVDKYLLLTRYVCKQRLSFKLARHMSSKLRWVSFCWNLSSLIIQINAIQRHDQIIESVGVQISVSAGVLLLSFMSCLFGRKVLMCFYSRQTTDYPRKSYSEEKKRIIERYQQVHPCEERIGQDGERPDSLIQSVLDNPIQLY